MTGLVYSVQRFSIHDGPGLRSTVFLKGCPLRCRWCHNPESWSSCAEFVRLRHLCMRCGRCPDGDLALARVGGKSAGDVDACPTGALQKVGERVEAAALVKTLLRDRAFFDESGGGVTVSGGEPLAQAAFLAEVLRLLRADGVHTALDTCGFGGWPELRDAAAHASLVLYDLKLIDPARHQAATGVSNEVILENLQALAAAHTAIWIRIPIVPGVNDDDENIGAIMEFLNSMPTIRRIDLLPYHRVSEAKFARLGLDDALLDARPPEPARLETLAARFRAGGLTTTIGGHA